MTVKELYEWAKANGMNYKKLVVTSPKSYALDIEIYEAMWEAPEGDLYDIGSPDAPAKCVEVVVLSL